MIEDSITVKLYNNSRFKNPEKQTSGSSGYDLYADLETPYELKPFLVNVIPTGVYVEIPSGFEGQVRARSGLASKNGIILVNGIGTIDSDYRGEIKVILMNLSNKSYIIKPGERIAQLVFSPIIYPRFEIVSSLNQLKKTQRNKGGFGHTG